MTNKVYVIAEIGINHNGSMEIADKLIRKAKEAGCNAVKFQKRDLDSVYTKEELSATRQSPWGTTNRQQKEGLEFSVEQYNKLQTLTKNLGMDFGVSCWDLKSVELMEKFVPLDFHKVASALLTSKDFLLALKATGKPLMISTGMSSADQVSSALAVLGQVDTAMACTSTYPTKPEEVNLRYVQSLRGAFNASQVKRVGFSNHYNGHDACVGAVALGAQVIEFHITMDRTMYGSDQSASIENVHELLNGIRTMELMVGDGIKHVYDTEVSIAKKLRKVTDL